MKALTSKLGSCFVAAALLLGLVNGAAAQVVLDIVNDFTVTGNLGPNNGGDADNMWSVFNDTDSPAGWNGSGVLNRLATTFKREDTSLNPVTISRPVPNGPYSVSILSYMHHPNDPSFTGDLVSSAEGSTIGNNFDTKWTDNFDNTIQSIQFDTFSVSDSAII